MCRNGPPHIPGHCPPEYSGLGITEEEVARVVAEVRSADGSDPFCPRHGKKSRPVEILGLRCDCPEEKL